MMDVIAVKGLDFSYGNTQILKNINFTVPEADLRFYWDQTGQEKAP